jgi:signal transduction histidine kinase
MRLADFILRNMEAILVQWEAFAAAQLPAAVRMTPLALRDHAQEILEAIAADLSTPQTREAQIEKSKGRAPVLSDAPETGAQTHAVLRARSGFSISQLAAEYRALRSSVLRLWMDMCDPEEIRMDDIIRFNEAIDQALAESIGFFSTQVEQARNLLLGMLGHDMRSPLQTIQMTASYLAALNAGAKVSEAASRLILSGARINALLDDLIDFNRTRLGLGINITPAEVDLAVLFANELEQLRAAHPDRRLILEVAGDTGGLWDGLRLQQLLGNLVTNAIKYGAPDAPVRVVVTGEEADLRFEVRNAGPVIEPSALSQIFEPLKRGPGQENRYNADGSLGLGLYIAREIARAHGGEIEARSDQTETVFAVRLPRRQERS